MTLYKDLKMPPKEIRILTTTEYQTMHQTISVVHNREEHQNMKLNLLVGIKAIYGDKWFRLQPATKKAIDRLAWLAANKGYAFPNDDTLADTYGISPRTVRGFIQFLRENGLIYVVYFRAQGGNGRRGHVMLFMDHPLFDHWAKFLRLNFVECQQDDSEILCGTNMPK